MSTSKLLSGILYLLGVALIVGGFYLFGSGLPEKIFVLNIIVSSVIFLLIFADLFYPLIDFKDKSQRRVGSLGIHWAAISTYSVLAISLMLVANLVQPSFSFNLQLILHGVLVFVLLLGFIARSNVSDKVNQVYNEEQEQRYLLEKVKKAAYGLSARIQYMDELPASLRLKAEQLSESIRYISPTNNSEAVSLESELLNKIEDINLYLNREYIDPPTLEKEFLAYDQAYKKRKLIYSK